MAECCVTSLPRQRLSGITGPSGGIRYGDMGSGGAYLFALVVEVNGGPRALSGVRLGLHRRQSQGPRSRLERPWGAREIDIGQIPCAPSCRRSRP